MKTVLCHGVFDLIHSGHLEYFKAAKKYGDKLIVSITTDRFVNKGPNRPYFNTVRRAQMVNALDIVDDIYISDEPTAVGAINEIKPDFYVKGQDYANLENDITGGIYEEKAAVEKYGGKLVFTNEETYSSSTIINKFFQHWTDEQRSTIGRIKDFGGIEACRKALNQIAELKILVVGEPILDVYRFVRPEGISSKSPSISARFEKEETYYGGSWAIKNHLLSFANSVNLVCPSKPCSKVRYLSGAQRIFEVTDIDESIPNREFLADKIIEESKLADIVIIADFGHGLFEGKTLEALEHVQKFIGLNVQTNSSNYGFNPYTKHQKFDYLCLDTREARLARHDRYSHPLSVAHSIKESIKRPFGFTAGPGGAYYMYGANTYYSPAFSDTVIDATGAGDAYFAITTCLVALGILPELVPFIGNVFAGLKTKIIGNKEAVSKASLIKAIEGILK